MDQSEYRSPSPERGEEREAIFGVDEQIPVANSSVVDERSSRILRERAPEVDDRIRPLSYRTTTEVDDLMPHTHEFDREAIDEHLGPTSEIVGQVSPAQKGDPHRNYPTR